MAGLQVLAQLTGSAGWAIILFTLLIRLVLVPLTLKQLKSSKAMQDLQPRLRELQKKYEKDKEKLAAETMALYKAHGVNPAAGCLPLFLQMPILFALYWALQNLARSDPAFQASFWWMRSLKEPDVLQISSTPLPGLMPILAGVTQWVQTRMMTPHTDDPQQKMQNSIMQFMPLMIVWFGLSFPSGLALYWVASNLFSIVQQYFITGWGSLLPQRAPALAAADAGRSGQPASAAEGAESRPGTVRLDGRNIQPIWRRFFARGTGQDSPGAAPAAAGSNPTRQHRPAAVRSTAARKRRR